MPLLYSTAVMTSTTGDSPDDDGGGVATNWEARQLRERAGAMRLEASIA